MYEGQMTDGNQGPYVSPLRASGDFPPLSQPQLPGQIAQVPAPAGRIERLSSGLSWMLIWAGTPVWLPLLFCRIP